VSMEQGQGFKIFTGLCKGVYNHTRLCKGFKIHRPSGGRGAKACEHSANGQQACYGKVVCQNGNSNKIC